MNVRSVSAVLGFLVVTCSAFVGCNRLEQDESASCEEILAVCHDAGESNAEAAACHDDAHEGDLDICKQIHDDCITLCEGVLGAGGGGGQGGALVDD